jgi:acetyl-CoA carboxylase carboxyltransferase component
VYGGASVTPTLSSEATIERSAFSAADQLALLCDPGSLQLIRTEVLPWSRDTGKVIPGDGVIGGAGMVRGQPMFCFAQDPTVKRGALGVVGAETIVRILDLAHARKVPVVGCLDSGGARIYEGSPALAGYARIFRRQVAIEGHAPQIMLITGVAAGGSAYAAALADFRIMTADAAMFLTGPKVVEEVLGESVDSLELGGPSIHGGSGLCDFSVPDVPAALRLARELLGLLSAERSQPAPESPTATEVDGIRDEMPAASESEGAPSEISPAAIDDPGTLVPSNFRKTYDVRQPIAAVVDSGRLLESSPRYGRSIFTGFARLDGRPVAIVASQPRHFGGVIDVDGSHKGAAFVRRAAALGVPLVVFVDTPGFLPGRQQESAGIIGRGAELLRAFAGARVPRVTVVLRRALGGAFITMNSRDLGADFAFAWSGAQIGVMGPQQAVSVLHGRQLQSDDERRLLEDEYVERHLDARVAAELGVIDGMIEAPETRTRLVWALSILCDEKP